MSNKNNKKEESNSNSKKESKQPEQKIETEVVNEGTSVEKVQTEDPKAAILEEDLSDDKYREKRIQEIKDKIAWNNSHDKSEQKEVTLAEENLVYGHVQE